MHALALALVVAADLDPGPTPMADSVVAFSRLGSGEELRIHFRSSGCFHNDVYDLVFQSGPRPTVTVAGVRYGFIRSMARDRAPRSVGTLALSDSEVAGLDALLRLYRDRPRGDCTTTEIVDVAYVRDGAVLASETFIDGSCAIDRAEGITSLQRLIWRAEYGPGPGR